MKPIEKEALILKQQHEYMWIIVEQQIIKAFQAFNNFDTNIAKEVLLREKKVDAQELIIDHHAENYLVLFSPVAIDLRFVLSVIKITNNLERIGDFAESIAKYVTKFQTFSYPQTLLDQIQFHKMCDYVVEMFKKTHEAIIHEDTTYIYDVLQTNELLNDIYKAASPIIAEYAKDKPDILHEMFVFANMIYKLQRMGDRLSNIAENIVFYLNSKEIRHLK